MSFIGKDGSFYEHDENAMVYVVIQFNYGVSWLHVQKQMGVQVEMRVVA